MLEWWTSLCLTIGDGLFGWLLDLSPSATLIVVALGTSLVLTLARPLTTHQDLLRRAAADKQRLKTLVREARRCQDRAAVQRYRLTQSLVALKQLRAEGWPLLVALLPVAILATWCFERLAYLPPRAGEPVAVAVHAPVSAIDEIVHVVPQPGLAADGWVRRVEKNPDGGEPPTGLAVWRVRGAARVQPYELAFRYKDRTLRHELRVGQRTYSPPLHPHDAAGQWVTELRLRPTRLFGIVPGFEPREIPFLRSLPWLHGITLAPWLVAYLLITIPFVVILKRVLRIQ